MLRGIVLMLGLVWVCSTQAQITRLVAPGGNDKQNTCTETPCRTIGRAVEVATSGDIIQIAPGEYGWIPTIDKSLTLAGSGQDNVTIIDGQLTISGRPITISGEDVEVVISDLVIRNGTFVVIPGILARGGGIQVEGSSLTLTNVTLRNNVAHFGGGIYAMESDLTLTGVKFEGNRTVAANSSSRWGGGGLYAFDSEISMAQVEFVGNKSSGREDRGAGGGGLRVTGGALELNEVQFIDNEVEWGNGGGLHSTDSALMLTDVTFEQNVAIRRFAESPFGGLGGGIFHDSVNLSLLTRVDFIDNTAYFGGGMYHGFGFSELDTVKFSKNNAHGGAGMYIRGGEPSLTGVNFEENIASTGGGGGLFNMDGATPALLDVDFRNNAAVAIGGGMRNSDSNPVLTNVMFRGNRVGCGVGGGIGLCEGGQRGGGMANFNSNPVLTNVVFSGNTVHGSLSAGRGGGMSNEESAPRLTNVTFSGNRADGDEGGTGGGLYIDNQESVDNVVFIRNTVFWNNQDESGIGTAGASLFRLGGTPIPRIEFSLVQGMFPPGNGNLDGQAQANDPLFLSTPDPESAPTSTGNLRLRPESPVIDAGDNSAVDGIEIDLDGNPRIIGGIVDLGAYEFTGEIDDVIFLDRFEQ